MSTIEYQEQDDLPVPDELETLKQRATLMGITFHPSIGLDNLKKKVADHLADVPPVVTETTLAVTESVVTAVPEKETAGQYAKRMKLEAGALVRVRITCMNPNKKEWEGEIFNSGNSVVGSYKRYVPFNVDWHVEQILLNMIQARQCQVFYTVSENGQKVRRGKLIREFGIEILPQLTEKELADLAQRQAMANGTSA